MRLIDIYEVIFKAIYQRKNIVGEIPPIPKKYEKGYREWLKNVKLV